MNTFSWIFLLAVFSKMGVELWLSLRQGRYVLAHRASVPDAFKASVSLEAHQKAADYSMAKGRLQRVENVYGTVILLLWTLGGSLSLLFEGWQQFELPTLAEGVLFFLSFLFIGLLLELPFSYYKTFVLEEHFGFNRNTPALFFSDFIKEAVLLLVLAVLLILVALWLMSVAVAFWWLYLWAVWMVFSLFMLWAAPTYIAPLFNQFKPLEDVSLRQRVETLLQRCGFKSQGIFVMDGSRRSGHGNAYFTGLGNNKRIVLFDTLLKSLNEDQIESVLAHELGHLKRNHVIKNMLLLAGLSLVGLAGLAWIAEQPWFYSGLGVAEQSDVMALTLFMLVVPALMFFLRPLMTAMSRKYEYEADDYAASVVNSEHLVAALVALYQENASTLTPDPLVSAIYDSHPPAALRIAHLQGSA